MTSLAEMQASARAHERMDGLERLQELGLITGRELCEALLRDALAAYALGRRDLGRMLTMAVGLAWAASCARRQAATS